MNKIIDDECYQLLLTLDPNAVKCDDCGRLYFFPLHIKIVQEMRPIVGINHVPDSSFLLYSKCLFCCISCALSQFYTRKELPVYKYYDYESYLKFHEQYQNERKR